MYPEILNNLLKLAFNVLLACIPKLITIFTSAFNKNLDKIEKPEGGKIPKLVSNQNSEIKLVIH